MEGQGYNGNHDWKFSLFYVNFSAPLENMAEVIHRTRSEAQADISKVGLIRNKLFVLGFDLMVR